MHGINAFSYFFSFFSTFMLIWILNVYCTKRSGRGGSEKCSGDSPVSKRAQQPNQHHMRPFQSFKPNTNIRTYGIACKVTGKINNYKSYKSILNHIIIKNVVAIGRTVDGGLKSLPFFAHGSGSHASSMKCIYYIHTQGGLAWTRCCCLW